MKRIIDLSSGEVVMGREGEVLKARAIGSCVAVSAYSANKGIGGLAHIMFPGKSPPDGYLERTKYCEDALFYMFDAMARRGVDIGAIEVCLVGGANMLAREDTIGRDNVESVMMFFRKQRITIKGQAAGGTVRRGVSFDIERGSISFSEGDSGEKLLWLSQKKAAEFWINPLISVDYAAKGKNYR
ncbi:MAG: chemotaxis protein CheD [Candidatus Omnitrophota bacterium]